MPITLITCMKVGLFRPLLCRYMEKKLPFRMSRNLAPTIASTSLKNHGLQYYQVVYIMISYLIN